MANIKRFDNVVEAIKHLEPGHILCNCLERRGVALKHSSYEEISMPNGTTAALSCPTSLFYRGEKKCYSSCKASLYRIKQRDDRIIALLKSYEFMLFLETLPEVKNYINNNRYYVPWALAQHYEFVTPMIDITSDISVAAFFATHYYDRLSKEYRLVKEGMGRIRFIANMAVLELKGSLQPIGMQPFARPDRQDGYGFWISESEDLDDYSNCVEFVQDYDVNLKLKTAMMDGVNYLFPNEQVSYMAQIIKNTDIVTRRTIETMLSDIARGITYIVPDVTEDDIDRVVNEKNIFVVDVPATCPEALPHMTNAFVDESRLVVRPAYR